MKELLTMIGCLYLLVIVNIVLGMVYTINLKTLKLLCLHSYTIFAKLS